MTLLSCLLPVAFCSSDQHKRSIKKADRAVLHRCKGRGRGGPNAFEQHMALRLAKVPANPAMIPVALQSTLVQMQWVLGSALYCLGTS